MSMIPIPLQDTFKVMLTRPCCHDDLFSFAFAMDTRKHMGVFGIEPTNQFRAQGRLEPSSEYG